MPNNNRNPQPRARERLAQVAFILALVAIGLFSLTVLLEPSETRTMLVFAAGVFSGVTASFALAAYMLGRR